MESLHGRDDDLGMNNVTSTCLLVDHHAVGQLLLVVQRSVVGLVPIKAFTQSLAAVGPDLAVLVHRVVEIDPGSVGVRDTLRDAVLDRVIVVMTTLLVGSVTVGRSWTTSVKGTEISVGRDMAARSGLG